MKKMCNFFLEVWYNENRKEKKTLKTIIIDERMRPFEKEKLKNMGYNLVEIKKSLNVYEEIGS